MTLESALLFFGVGGAGGEGYVSGWVMDVGVCVGFGIACASARLSKYLFVKGVDVRVVLT